MNGFRRLLGLAVVLTLAVFSQAGIAAKGGNNNGTDKSYSLDVDSTATATYAGTPPTIVTPVMVKATLTNLAPPSSASSNVGSWELLITNPGVTFFADDGPHKPFGSTNGVVNGVVTPIFVDNVSTRIVVTGMAPLKGKAQYELTFWVTSCGDAQYDATVHTGSSLNGDLFGRLEDKPDLSNLQTLIKCADPGLACGEHTSIVADAAETRPDLLVTRGTYNKDGGTCATSTFYASNKLLTGNGQVHFRWPVAGSGSSAVFSYSVTSAIAAVPKLGWLYADGSGAATDAISDKPVAYISAPQCLPTNGQPGILPAPYGVLNNNVSPNATQIKVNTSPQNAVLPTPSGEFDIVIGAERMHVVSVQGSTWNVLRRQGGTGLPATGYQSGNRVMSTPLPLINSTDAATLADGTSVTLIPAGRTTPYPYDLPPLGIGLQAQMCIVGSPVQDEETGVWSSTIIDIGDGWVRIGQ
jgi:hypothetical protein